MKRQKQYIIERVPYEKLDVSCRSEYGKVWYCHMRDYPEICVGGSVGSRKHAQNICNLMNQRYTKA